jgi:folylpolyglutamate synthase/dihydropteroate synthase
MLKAGAALRRLIGTERLIAVFAMLGERDPSQLIDALRTLNPEACVFTEAASAAGHAVSAEVLAEAYGAGGHAVRPAADALQRAREMAGPNGNVLVSGSLYLVGEILALSAQQSYRARRNRAQK